MIPRVLVLGDVGHSKTPTGGVGRTRFFQDLPTPVGKKRVKHRAEVDFSMSTDENLVPLHLMCFRANPRIVQHEPAGTNSVGSS